MFQLPINLACIPVMMKLSLKAHVIARTFMTSMIPHAVAVVVPSLKAGTCAQKIRVAAAARSTLIIPTL
jgi:hypothetical protein